MVNLIHKLYIFIILITAFSSCTLSNKSRLDRLKKLDPIFGKNDLTSYVVGSQDKEVDLTRISNVASTIRKYRKIKSNEALIIQKLAQKKYNGYVLQELKALNKEFEKKRKIINQNYQKSLKQTQTVARAKIAKLSPKKSEPIIHNKKSLNSKKPSSKIKTKSIYKPPTKKANNKISNASLNYKKEQQIRAKLIAKQKELKIQRLKELKLLEQKRRQIAHLRVERKIGSNIAIKIRSKDKKSLATITNIKDGVVQTPDTLFEINSNTKKSKSSTPSNDSKIKHEGKDLTTIEINTNL